MTDWGKEWWKMTLVSNVIELSWLKVYYRWYSLAQDWRMGGWWYNSKGDKGDLEKKNKNSVSSIWVSGAKKHRYAQQAVGNASLSLHREIRVDNRMYHAENKYAYERIECWKIIRLQTEFGEMPTYR